MSSLGGHAGALARILEGRVDVDHVMVHAEAIAATALDDIWWDNSGYERYGETDALPKIWKQPDDFRSRIDRFQAAASDFVEAAESGERGRILQGFKALGESRGACHDSYRYEEWRCRGTRRRRHIRLPAVARAGGARGRAARARVPLTASAPPCGRGAGCTSRPRRSGGIRRGARAGTAGPTSCATSATAASATRRATGSAPASSRAT